MNLRKNKLEKYQEIERSIITTYRSRLWSKFTKAIKDYKLVNENDKICVCISGGKDSMLLAKLFEELHKHSNINFEVIYLVMNPGYNKVNLDLIKHNLKYLNINAEIVNTDIFSVTDNAGGSPCYLCARMRRGALYRLAQERGCNKIALGHHFDDVIETTLLNILNAGSFQTMLPKLHSDNFENMELIRPMYLIREKDIIAWKEACELEFIRCACRMTESVENELEHDLNSKRHETKQLIKSLIKYNDNVEKNIFKSASNVNLDKVLGYKKGKNTYSFLDNYDN
ncbi:MAG TPA: tRNA 2-thiocytidine(32) synthetase TtcA [Clostridiales bacterium]|nr:tRNA 2-thiocytidine(32) synthetase TtcA [Clostridiales bacterium]